MGNVVFHNSKEREDEPPTVLLGYFNSKNLEKRASFSWIVCQ